MPPSNNVPVAISSGESFGDKKMTRQALYSYMIYHVSREDDDTVKVFRAASRAISEGFEDWKENCFIVGIMASGGIAPHPAPMGAGPGPVRGAKGKNGKLKGAYFDSELMNKRMVAYLDT